MQNHPFPINHLFLFVVIRKPPCCVCVKGVQQYRPITLRVAENPRNALRIDQSIHSVDLPPTNDQEGMCLLRLGENHVRKRDLKHTTQSCFALFIQLGSAVQLTPTSHILVRVSYDKK